MVETRHTVHMSIVGDLTPYGVQTTTFGKEEARRPHASSGCTMNEWSYDDQLPGWAKLILESRLKTLLRDTNLVWSHAGALWSAHHHILSCTLSGRYGEGLPEIKAKGMDESSQPSRCANLIVPAKPGTNQVAETHQRADGPSEMGSDSPTKKVSLACALCNRDRGPRTEKHEMRRR